MTMHKERILLAREDKSSGTGLLEMLRSQHSFDLIDVVDGWVEALAKAEQVAPELVILNVRSMHPDWIDVCRAIREKHPYTTIIAVAESRQRAREAINAGVNAFITRNLPFCDILRITGTVTEKSGVLIFPDGEAPTYSEISGDTKGTHLSKREKDVLVLLAKGFHNKEIARRLSIQVPTVNNHLYHIFRKLGCSNRTEAVVEAVKKGVIDMTA
jgi:DNA-binding NarL/FixJ family response regulator